MMPESHIWVKSVDVCDGGKTLVAIHDLKLPLASVSVLVGPSGCGKTIAAQALLGLLSIAAPNLTARREVVFPDVGQFWRISYVPQGTGSHLQPTVALRAQMRGLICGQGGLPPGQYREEEVARLLRDIRIAAPEQTLAQTPAELSGGMLQRILLIIAVMRRPHFMVLDEPTTALDGYARAQAYKIILTCCQEHNTAVLLLTHSGKDIAVLADRVYAIENGRIAPVAPITAPAPPAAAESAKARFAPPEPHGPHESRDAFVADSLSVVLQPKQLFRPFSFGKLGKEQRRQPFLLAPFSVALRPGDCFGIIGESGCGKTTLLRALGLLADRYQGAVWLDGQNLSALSPRQLRRRRRFFQTVFQDSSNSLNPFLSVRELLHEPRLLHGYPTLTDGQLQEHLDQALLPKDILDQPVGELSFGQRQRLALLRVLTGFPELRALIVDEPFAGLDHEATLAMIALWRARAAALVTIIASHDIEWISALCTHIHLMQAGAHLETIRPPEKFASDYAHRFWQAGWIANRAELSIEPENGISQFRGIATEGMSTDEIWSLTREA